MLGFSTAIPFAEETGVLGVAALLTKDHTDHFQIATDGPFVFLVVQFGQDEGLIVILLFQMNGMSNRYRGVFVAIVKKDSF